MDPRKKLCAAIATMRGELDKLVEALGNDPNLERPIDAARAIQAIQEGVNAACTDLMIQTFQTFSALLIEDIRRK